jgi:hypothetical protein
MIEIFRRIVPQAGLFHYPSRASAVLARNGSHSVFRLEPGSIIAAHSARKKRKGSNLPFP